MDVSLATPSDVGVLSLCLSAISIGFFHTLLGPDHYVPFVAMSQVGRWSLRKTVVVTLLCGFGHVGSSIMLGLIGVALGIFVLQLESIESFRGDLAGWLLLAFGLAYFLWGVRHAMTGRPHRHVVLGRRGFAAHTHCHAGLLPRAAAEPAVEGGEPPLDGSRRLNAMTPWVLAVIFVLGPCEPLIPLLMYPAARANMWAVAYVSLLFGAATVVTMTLLVVLMRLGARLAHLERFHHYAHAIAGFAVLASGLAVKLGL